MNTLKKLLHPEGVSGKYIKYMRWSFASNILASTQQTLVVHNMLLGVNSAETDNMKTINYVGKDVIGQMGSLIYMANMAEKADKDPRKFLRYSNIFQQLSYAITCASSMTHPMFFLPQAGIANTMINISFTGFGTINAKCIKEISNDNMGEIYAKLTVINTLGSSLGMIMGVILLSFVPEPENRIFLVMLFGIGRIYTFNKAVEEII